MRHVGIRRIAGGPRRRVRWQCGCILLAILAGCQGDQTNKELTGRNKETARPVRVIVVDDPAFAETLHRQWSARTENELQLEEVTAEQLGALERLGGDIIIYPSACLGTLAQRNLIAPPLQDIWNAPGYARQDVFELQRNVEVSWGEQLYAFSFGSPQLVLMYRPDLFAERGLESPATWQDYGELAQQLTREKLGELAPAEGQEWTPLCEPLGPGWAGKTLLARAASYASHPSQFSVLFDYTTMAPLIAGPPFVRALEELVAARTFGSPDADRVTPELARQRLYAGTTAMALAWPSRATSAGEPLERSNDVEIGFAELPGAHLAYHFGDQEWTPHDQEAPVHVPLIAVAGKLGSVARDARRPREAAEILALLTGTQWSERLSPSSQHTTLFRYSHMVTPALWTDSNLPPEASEAYAELVAATQGRPLYVSAPRIACWQQYLDALDQAVYAACDGEMTAEEALARTAEQWAAITAELGKDSQRQAYTRSLGLEP